MGAVMFKLANKRQVWWPVKIRQPKDDGSGQVDDIEVQVLFELLTRTEARALEAAEPAEIEATLRRKIKGWRGMGDADGEVLDFSDDSLNAALDVPYIERAFSLGLLQASVGSPAKN